MTVGVGGESGAVNVGKPPLWSDGDSLGAVPELGEMYTPSVTAIIYLTNAIPGLS
jgi:hypothetical protein